MIITRLATRDRRIHRVLIRPEPQPVRLFPHRWLRKGVREGWIKYFKIDGGPAIEFLSHPRVVYKLVRQPGTWCAHCGLVIPRHLAPEHVARQHPNQPSPDPEAPYGFKVEHRWLAVRVR